MRLERQTNSLVVICDTTTPNQHVTTYQYCTWRRSSALFLPASPWSRHKHLVLATHLAALRRAPAGAHNGAARLLPEQELRLQLWRLALVDVFVGEYGASEEAASEWEGR